MARVVSQTVKSLHGGPGYVAAGSKEFKRVTQALENYGTIIAPWAQSVAEYMLADVARRNEKAWVEHGREMGVEFKKQIQQTGIGHAYRALMAEQVTLIQSIPLDAAEKVHEMVEQGLHTSERSAQIAKRVMELADMPMWRAKLIARTEVSRSAVTLTQVRAQNLGSHGYIWRTSRDGDVRPTHKEMEGVYVPWDHPPKTDKSLSPYHAGCGPNCRCWPEPVLPEY